MSHKIYSPLHVPHTRKIHVAANFANINLERVIVGYDQLKSSDFLKKNPNGKFPVLETTEGKFIFESGAILRYVARLDLSKGLYGGDILEQTYVDQWLDWFATELVPNLWQYTSPYFGFPGTKESVKAAESKTRSLLKILDDHLKTNTFIVGKSVTIADINAATYFFNPFRFLWDEKFRKSIPNISRWYETLIGQEPFTKEFGRPFLCNKSLEFPSVAAPEKKEEHKKEEHHHDKKKEEHHGDKKKEEHHKDKKDDKPKAEKKPAKDKDEDDEGEEPAEKKEKNPLDLLPPSTFNLFDFKTLFVNAPNKQEALDFFWKNFDAAGYSIWFIEYIKAEGEGQVLFLTNNLMNGFIQRLDHFRKYAFGVHGVYGEEPTLEIRGVWLWRGTEIPNEVKELDSFEYHKFSKLDHTNAAHKKKVNEFWNGLNEDVDIVDGLKARTVKYFK